MPWIASARPGAARWWTGAVTAKVVRIRFVNNGVLGTAHLRGFWDAGTVSIKAVHPRGWFQVSTQTVEPFHKV